MHVSTAQFSWHPDMKCFLAEASDFGKYFGMSQINGDEVGITLTSTRTQKTACFRLVEVRRDADRDVQFWRFRPTAKDLIANPKLANVQVKIFND